MTLYSQAKSNIQKTWLLITIFLVFIILLGWLFSYLLGSSVILIIAVIFSILISFLSYWYSDKIVLKMTRAQPIKKEDNPELYQILENLCLTAGLARPKIYLLPEAQPNAFATGRNEKQAVVAVTKGLLKRLEKKELAGVIAHELSHIKNKDMLLGTIAVVLAGIIALVSHWFLRMTFWGGLAGRRSRDSGAVILLILALIAAILAPIAATLIRLAISRKREFLADASGALLTRDPQGLAQALEKIAADSTPMRAASNATAHLFISSPFKDKQLKSWFTKLFMTHPPVEERIKALRNLRIERQIKT